MTARNIRAPRGAKLNCKGWHQEAALRCLMNNLDPEVAEKPDELIVYGGAGKAARNWPAFEAIVRSLLELENDETLLVQSGKPVGIFRTHEYAARVLIANSNLVGAWANWDHFHELERKGLMMYGQMTAGSWIYIGTQGIVQGTFETFAAMADRHFGGDLAGRLLVSGGLGGMGGAQPLDEALDICEDAREQQEAVSVGLVGNCAELLPEIVRRGVKVDIVTDQTSAHDPLNGYVPAGLSVEGAIELRRIDADGYVQRSMESMARQVEAMLALKRSGAVVFDYGNNIRKMAFDAGCKDAFEIPGFVPEYIRPLFCEGKGPFRWVALSGAAEDIRKTDDLALELFPDDKTLNRWLRLSRDRIQFQGLPARICWLGYGERAEMGEAINDLVRRGDLKAPIAIGRDHLDTGSVASPFRETEGMKDGSDAVADWPILNALLNTASGASWVSFHHGGGVGIGYSLHAGQVSVADGTDEAAKRLNRVLTNDPGIGVARHADAGYEEAEKTAREKGIKIPMLSATN